jgi:ribonucleoside-diphosphate reductase alpha chain
MRVAMGLALNEPESQREARAIEFYNVLSSFDLMSSTPTLFNSGTRRSQLASCYLTTVSDDLDGIYEAIKENAMLQKYAGGIGNDWTPVRALGAYIKGTNGKSQGVVPFLKVVNDTAVAVNQGGKRKGAVCSYLETWHLDIEEFLELRKNTGDDRRRTHDMNTSNWIPDLFMKRVMEGGDWTLFSPSDVPDLHEKFGKAFEKAYVEYEAMCDRGEMKLYKKVPANQLWRKMLTMLFETGHPWITFKDPCNLRSPQQHVGVVHSSNLCTEITLNTGPDEIAVCNLASVNYAGAPGPVHRASRHGEAEAHGCHRHAHARQRDRPQLLQRQQGAQLQLQAPPRRPRHHGFPGLPAHAAHSLRLSGGRRVRRPLDGAGDLHRLLGLLRPGGRARPVLDLQGLVVGSRHPAAGFAEGSGGRARRLCRVRHVDETGLEALRSRIQRVGIRNSNCIAIAPTATIANITGLSQCIEPTYQNLYVKSNLSGEFTVVNEFLVRDLKKLNLWDEVMIADLKYFDGSLEKIDRVPPDVRSLYATAFEIDASWLVECAARRSEVDRPVAVAEHLHGRRLRQEA